MKDKLVQLTVGKVVLDVKMKPPLWHAAMSEPTLVITTAEIFGIYPYVYGVYVFHTRVQPDLCTILCNNTC